MNPNAYSPSFGVRKLIKAVLLFTALLAVMLIVLYLFNHGRLTIENFAEWDSVTVQTGENLAEKITTVNRTSSVQKSGDQLVTLTKNGSEYSEYVKVGGWFKNTTIKPVLVKQSTSEKIANNTRELHLQVDSGKIYTADSAISISSIVVHNKITKFPYVENTEQKLPSKFTPFIVFENTFMGLGSSNTGQFIGKYNPATNSIDELASLPIADTKPVFYTSGIDGGGIVYYDGVDFYYLKNTNSKPRPLSVPKGSFSFGDNAPVGAISKQKLYLYNGPTSSLFEVVSDSSEKNNTKPKSNSMTITSYDLEGVEPDETLKLNPEDFGVSQILASPSDKYIGLVTSDGTLNIYDSQTLDLVKLLLVNSLGEYYWRNDSNIIALDNASGLKNIDIANGSISTIFYSKMVSYIGLEKYGNTTYVTAKYKPTENEKIRAINSSLDINHFIYRIDLDIPATEESVNNSLPYITNNFSIDSLNNKVVFIPTTGDLNDPLYSNSGLYKSEIEKRIASAKDYLKMNGIDSNNVEFLQSLKFNLKLFWGK